MDWSRLVKSLLIVFGVIAFPIFIIFMINLFGIAAIISIFIIVCVGAISSMVYATYNMLGEIDDDE